MGLELIISEMKAFIKHIHRLKPEKNLKINATVMKVQEKGKKKNFSKNNSFTALKG